MTSLERLLKRQAALKRAINAHLDLLIGTVNKTPAQSGWYLTAKVDGKSVTRYVRASIRTQAKKMTRNHTKVRELLRRLSQVNWELLVKESGE
ncbi:hypothetical protein GX586_07030, partial [bacterium]|nr:hypothetical protein [bacterium]